MLRKPNANVNWHTMVDISGYLRLIGQWLLKLLRRIVYDGHLAQCLRINLQERMESFQHFSKRRQAYINSNIQNTSGISCLLLHTKNMEVCQSYIYPQNWENGLHDSKVISANLFNILFIKGIGETGRLIPKGWPTCDAANASQTTCLSGRKVNRKFTPPTRW